MKNYNEDFCRWLAKAKELDPKTASDLPEELQKEFSKLMFLANIPFQDIFGENPNGVCDLLHTVLLPSEVFDREGEPMEVVLVAPDRVFVSPVADLVAQPPLYAEDAEGRRFVFLYCDHHGPALGEAATVFDAIHEPLRQEGVAPEELPDVFFIFITDHDICGRGQQVMRMDPKTEAAELSRQGDGDLPPDPAFSKWHTIFFNPTVLS
ncbi:MAG: hypothetical protein IJ714_05835 [Bacteroidales bacterium]|nr:hypothetical protein [Bacteroidales bacterium]